MAKKELKLNLKNAQIAKAINFDQIKSQLEKKTAEGLKDTSKVSAKDTASEKKSEPAKKVETSPEAPLAEHEAPRRKARSKSVFVESEKHHEAKVDQTQPSAINTEIVAEVKSKDHVKENIDIEKQESMISQAEKIESNPKIISTQDSTQQSHYLPKSDSDKIEANDDKSIKTEATKAEPQAHDSKNSEIKKTEAKTYESKKIDNLRAEANRGTSSKPSPFEKTTPKESSITKEIPSNQSHSNYKAPTTPVYSTLNKKDMSTQQPTAIPVKKEKLGPTGRHVKDLIPPKPPKREPPRTDRERGSHDRGPGSGPRQPNERFSGERPPARERRPGEREFADRAPQTDRFPGTGFKKVNLAAVPPKETDETSRRSRKPSRVKEYKDFPSSKKGKDDSFDSDGKELHDDYRWKKKRGGGSHVKEDATIRPSSITIRTPISVKDLAAAMKLKASELIAKLFLQGIVLMINDFLDDETTIKLLGEEFSCQINIDTSEEERIRITDKTIEEEVSATDPSLLTTRAPVVTFMGHVDHGKTSLIDYIRKSNTASGEAGAITQHIGAFLCKTNVGDIAVLDTPGHEAFSEMRARGANVTDIVVLVVSGEEGIRAQTDEAIKHAKAAGVTIVVALNKCDKPNFDAENIYRQLAERELLPEAWGGQTLTVNCSAVTGQGVNELLDTLALQAEVLEIKANPTARARGTVLESEMHKGMGSVATILVQNGTLRIGDPLVFAEHWGKVKTMRDEFNNSLKEAGPSTPVEITGISGLPEAGEEFIVVTSEKEAKQIAEARMLDKRQLYLQGKKTKYDSLLQQAESKEKKILNIVLRADVQGSMEALKVALQKIKSTKANIEIVSAGIGEISESDVLLAAASNAIILGFHTQIESHAESLLKQYGVHISLHDIIYHAVDDVRGLLTGLLEKIAQENEKGKAEVRAVFKASQIGKIAGCIVSEGAIHRNNQIRVMRGDKKIWQGNISSLKRVQDDVREVQKGVECGIVLSGFSDFEVGDILEAFEVVYIAQEL